MNDPARADFQDDQHVQVRNVAVMVTKKSQASMAPAWLRTNVLHCWDDRRS